MTSFTLYCLVIIVSIVVLLGQLGTCSSVVLRHSVSDGSVIELNINVNLNGQPIKKEEHENVKKQNKQVKAIVSQVSKTISTDEEEKISEQLLINGNEFRQIAKMIPGNTPEETKLKSQFLALAGELSKESKKPSALILESAYVTVQHDFDAQTKHVENSSGVSVLKQGDLEEEPLLQSSLSPRNSKQQGAKTLILDLIVRGAMAVSTITDFIDGIGSYSSTLGSVSKWVTDSAAKKLDDMGMNTLANVARSTGQSISELSNKVAPYEKELAEKIKPVVTDPRYRSVKTGIDVVSIVTSVAGATKALAKNAVKLPENFRNIQNSLSTIAKKVENPKQLIEGITGAAVSGFNRLTGKSGVLSNSVLERNIRRNAKLVGSTAMRVNNIASSTNDIKEGVEKLTGTKKEQTLEEKMKEQLQVGNLANSFVKNRFGKSVVGGGGRSSKGNGKQQSGNRKQPKGNGNGRNRSQTNKGTNANKRNNRNRNKSGNNRNQPNQKNRNQKSGKKGNQPNQRNNQRNNRNQPNQKKRNGK